MSNTGEAAELFVVGRRRSGARATQRATSTRRRSAFDTLDLAPGDTRGAAKKEAVKLDLKALCSQHVAEGGRVAEIFGVSPDHGEVLSATRTPRAKMCIECGFTLPPDEVAGPVKFMDV